MQKIMQQTIEQNYGLKIKQIRQVTGGWAALAFLLITEEEKKYFLKVYEQQRASTPVLTASIADYVPVTKWLDQHSRLAGKMAVSLQTIKGEYSCEDQHGVYLLYPFIDGFTVGDRKLTNPQVSELASMVSELHRYGKEISVETAPLKEDFHLPYPDLFQTISSGKIPKELQVILAPHFETWNSYFKLVTKLSQRLIVDPPRMVLCHTDLHHWNLMQTAENLILIDWEGLTLAPPEADLFHMIDRPYSSYFLRIYQEAHQGFEIDQVALQFYQIRRSLEDIAEFCEQLLYDRLTEEEYSEIQQALLQEFRQLET
ncbi:MULTISPECIES: aminoglycoside phosphotransferase family protein [Gracilibacillus]|uniref:aminoglycoside phosphotransferase family protein n=1 Tax=Gracilibacillus TaxID=74385 RepID=UPI00082513FF|nr:MULTISPECIES: aminoglycoside phosphotransferase family protein [Gracilibacillus]